MENIQRNIMQQEVELRNTCSSAFMKNYEPAVDFWHLSPGIQAAAGPYSASNRQVSMIIWSSRDIVNCHRQADDCQILCMCLAALSVTCLMHLRSGGKDNGNLLVTQLQTKYYTEHGWQLKTTITSVFYPQCIQEE